MNGTDKKRKIKKKNKKKKKAEPFCKEEQSLFV